MPLGLAIPAFIIGLVLLIGGAEFLIRGAARLARRMGLSPFVIGVTIVAFGTSAPELAASVRATLSDRGGFAVGNVLGSNIANICLILGATALIRPIVVRPSVVRRDVPLMIAITAIGAFVLWDASVTRVEGIALAAGIVAYVVYNYVAGRRDPDAIDSTIEIEHEHGLELEQDEPENSGLLINLLMTLGGLIALAGGAELLLAGAASMASAIGVPDHVIAITLVAFGTSVPELAASARAALGRQSDIAVGNILGSNVFNLLSVLGIAAIVRPIHADGELLRFHILVMAAVAVICLPIMGTGDRITRLQGGGLFAAYLLYAVVVFLA